MYEMNFRVLGACPRTGVLFKIEKFQKNKHSHMFDITSIIFWKSRRVWAGKRRLQESILGQPPSETKRNTSLDLIKRHTT
jgi:hypothetical protein